MAAPSMNASDSFLSPQGSSFRRRAHRQIERDPVKVSMQGRASRSGRIYIWPASGRPRYTMYIRTREKDPNKRTI